MSLPRRGASGADSLAFAAFQEYTKAIDIWSVGCILAEMSAYAEVRVMDGSDPLVNGKPIFPGRGTLTAGYAFFADSCRLPSS